MNKLTLTVKFNDNKVDDEAVGTELLNTVNTAYEEPVFFNGDTTVWEVLVPFAYTQKKLTELRDKLRAMIDTGVIADAGYTFS